MVGTPNTSQHDDLEDPDYEMLEGEHEEQHVEEPAAGEDSKLSGKNIQELDIPLSSPRHDHARLRAMKSLGKVSREKRHLERRAVELDDAWEQY